MTLLYQWDALEHSSGSVSVLMPWNRAEWARNGCISWACLSSCLLHGSSLRRVVNPFSCGLLTVQCVFWHFNTWSWLLFSMVPLLLLNAVYWKCSLNFAFFFVRHCMTSFACFMGGDRWVVLAVGPPTASYAIHSSCVHHREPWAYKMCVSMSKVLRLIGLLACGGAIFSREAVLHPFWLKIDGLLNLLQMTSAPGLQLLLGCLIMLQCYSLCGGLLWGSVLLGAPVWKDVGAEGRTHVSSPMLQSCPPNLAWSCGVMRCFKWNEMGSVSGLAGNWQTDLTPYL